MAMPNIITLVSDQTNGREAVYVNGRLSIEDETIHVSDIRRLLSKTPAELNAIDVVLPSVELPALPNFPELFSDLSVAVK